VQSVSFYILHIVKDVYDRSDERKNNKSQHRDYQGVNVKKTKAEKEGNKNEQVFNVVVEAQ
jgi:hypothetical protein